MGRRAFRGFKKHFVPLVRSMIPKGVLKFEKRWRRRDG